MAVFFYLFLSNPIKVRPLFCRSGNPFNGIGGRGNFLGEPRFCIHLPGCLICLQPNNVRFPIRFRLCSKMLCSMNPWRESSRSVCLVVLWFTVIRDHFGMAGLAWNECWMESWILAWKRLSMNSIRATLTKQTNHWKRFLRFHTHINPVKMPWTFFRLLKFIFQERNWMGNTRILKVERFKTRFNCP